MGKAVMSIRPELFFDLLKLPRSFKYKGAEFSFHKQAFNIMIEHEKFPDNEIGEILPNLMFEYTRLSNNEVLISKVIIDNKEIEINNVNKINMYNLDKYWDSSRDDYSDRPDILFQEEYLSYLNDSAMIIDLGCGNGTLVHKLNERGKKAFGITYNQDEVTNRKHKHVSFGDMHDINYEDLQYDAFIMWDSLEHCQSAYIALCEARRILKWGGKGLIFMPGQNWLDCHCHICCYTVPQMKQLFRQSGLKLVNVHERKYPDNEKRECEGMAVYEVIKDETYKPTFKA